MKSFITTAVIFCFLLINSSIGAARTLKGYVSDNDGEAIAYASIALFNDSTFISALSADSCGIFSANITDIKSPRLRVGMHTLA